MWGVWESGGRVCPARAERVGAWGQDFGCSGHGSHCRPQGRTDASAAAVAAPDRPACPSITARSTQPGGCAAHDDCNGPCLCPAPRWAAGEAPMLLLDDSAAGNALLAARECGLRHVRTSDNPSCNTDQGAHLVCEPASHGENSAGRNESVLTQG